MREILFRGKRISTGEWVEGGIMRTFHPNFEHENEDAFLKQVPNCYCICTGGKDIFVEQESIGQFTGLTDKNGTKIFEGDIVRVCLDPEICGGNVIWDNEIASYNIPFNNGKCVLPLDIYIAKNKVGDKVWIEVIGNIHDNPELLEVEENG